MCTTLHTHTSGVSSLNHKLFDDTMKDVTIIVAITTVHTKVLHSLRTPKDVNTLLNSKEGTNILTAT